MRIAPFALFLLACGGQAHPPATSDLAPRPFTAEQIRDAMPVGLELRMQREIGGQPIVTTMLVTAADADGMTMVQEIHGPSGMPMGDPQTKTTTWKALLEHASFPAKDTVRSEGSVTVPLGTFPSIDYRVTTGDVVTTYRFARELPGPPVEIIEEKGGQVTQHMVMLSRERKK